MKKVIVIIYIVLAVPLTYYLIQNDPQFPEQIPNSIRSTEPGDMEDINRRAYYTDATRSEVLEYYQSQVDSNILSTYRLNYPPEDSQTLIRDQTRSTFLEEIVAPYRYSLYVNGFEPTLDKDKLIVDGKSWSQKVTVKYMSASTLYRTIITLLGLFLAVVSVTVFTREIARLFNNFIKMKKWIFQ